MGLFDTLKVEAEELELIPHKTSKFQTKSLGCGMNEYLIADKKLFKIEKEFDDKREIKRWRSEIKYHGEIHFYCCSYEYTAKFKYGKLINLIYDGEMVLKIL